MVSSEAHKSNPAVLTSSGMKKSAVTAAEKSFWIPACFPRSRWAIIGRVLNGAAGYVGLARLLFVLMRLVDVAEYSRNASRSIKKHKEMLLALSISFKAQMHFLSTMQYTGLQNLA